MQLSSSEPCVVILTEKEVEVSVNNHATFTLPKNYLAAFACNNNVIELSTLNHVLITHINRNIINDYLLFLNISNISNESSSNCQSLRNEGG